MIKQFIPKPIKRSLRRWHRAHALRHGVTVTNASLQRHELLSTELLQELVYGWSNEGWSANVALLQALLAESIDRQPAILECGTGISTLLLAMVCRHSGGSVRSLEHHAEWYAHIRQRLDKLGLAAGGITLSPLMNHGQFDWYDITRLPATETYDLVLCDGPPGSTHGGRFGLVPLLIARLRPGARIIVDDTSRREEATMIQQWLLTYPRLRIAEQHDSFTVLIAD